MLIHIPVTTTRIELNSEAHIVLKPQIPMGAVQSVGSQKELVFSY